LISFCYIKLTVNLKFSTNKSRLNLKNKLYSPTKNFLALQKHQSAKYIPTTLSRQKSGEANQVHAAETAKCALMRTLRFMPAAFS